MKTNLRFNKNTKRHTQRVTRKAFYKHFRNKRVTKDIVEPVLDVPGELVTHDAEKGEGPNAFVILTFEEKLNCRQVAKTLGRTDEAVIQVKSSGSR